MSSQIICFYLASGEMKENNLKALGSNMDIVISGLDVYHVFELKGKLTDSVVWNTGETGDINESFVTFFLVGGITSMFTYYLMEGSIKKSKVPCTIALII